MPSVSELITKYRNLPVFDLLKILDSPDGYTPEAQEAACIVINEKGGQEKIKQEFNANQNKQSEKRYLSSIISHAYKTGKTEDQILSEIKTQFLSLEEAISFVNEVCKVAEREKDDEEIKNKTIGGCVIGGIIGFVVAGVSYYFILTQDNRGLLIAIGGILIFNYFIIHALTKQTYKNMMVLMFTTVSTTLGLIVATFVRGFL